MSQRRRSSANRQNLLATVAAAVIEKNGKVLIARKKNGDRHEGRWEFPGGKVESGERPEEGLKREMYEEMGVEVEVENFLCAIPFKTADFTGRLLAYKTRLVSGDIHRYDHDQILWVEPAELKGFDFMEPDRLVIETVFHKARASAKKGRGDP